ncbi:hypothetical protein FPQ18DRAFT_345204 [Pyronema domesticum]|nr:hypothetical protein FPQ18DRAFT_345204 [Pyronema domesticum]
MIGFFCSRILVVFFPVQSKKPRKMPMRDVWRRSKPCSSCFLPQTSSPHLRDSPFPRVSCMVTSHAGSKASPLIRRRSRPDEHPASPTSRCRAHQPLRGRVPQAPSQRSAPLSYPRTSYRR